MPTYVPYDAGGSQPVAASDNQSPYVAYTGDVVSPSAPKTVADTQQASLFDQFKRQLGLTARAGITGITGTGAAIGDALVGGANMLGANLPKPSDAQQQMMTRMGLPEPQGAMENIAQVGSSILAGGMDPALNAVQAVSNKLAPSSFVSPSKQPAQNVVTKELHDAGYVLPPTEMNAGATARTAEGFGGKARTAQLAEYNNQEVTQRLAKQAINFPQNERLTAEALQSQAGELIKQGYDPIRQVAKVDVGSNYRNALQQIKSDLGGSDSFPLAQRNEVKQLVDKYLYTGDSQANGSPRLIQSYTGNDAINEISLLRKEASSKFARGEGLQGEAMRRVATALEDNIESSLKGQGSQLVGTFRTTREALAKNFAVERMLTDPNTGIVDASKAARLLQAGTPLTGELNTIAKAGGPMYQRATGVATGGKPPMINYGDSFLMGAGGGLAHMTGGASVGLTAFPVARAAARYGVLSKPAQSMMAGNLIDRQPSMFGADAARVGAGMPPQLLQLFGGQGQ